MAKGAPAGAAAPARRDLSALAAPLNVRTLIFAKAPVPGRVKTRLIPALGAQGAADLAAKMLERTLREALEAQTGPVELCTDPSPESPDWSGRTGMADSVSAQGQGDLGERLARAASRFIAAGEAVLLIGTDCPELDRFRLRRAAKRLGRFDAVIHPAQDGGYVLLGLNRFDPILFSGIAWSTSAVAAETLSRIRSLGWSLHVGETLRDIDEPRDLP